MNKLKHAAVALVIVVSLVLGGSTLDASARPLAVHSPSLGVANSFVILAAAGITDANTANTSINGDIGNYAGTGAQITDTDCSNMLGASTIYIRDDTFWSANDACLVIDDGFLNQAQGANTAAYGDLNATDNNISLCTDIPNELGGQSLDPGIYCPLQGNFQITGPSPLTLAGTGVWIFKTVALTVGADASVVGIDPCNVWWELASDTTAASIGTGADMIGNMLGLGSITFGDGASLIGRAFSQIGEVTLIGNDITNAICVASEGGGEERGSQVRGLPDTGGAPIRNTEFAWGLVIVGGVTAAALMLVRRSSARKSASKK